MRTIERTTKFKRDYKREKKSDRELDEALIPVITTLAADSGLPERMRPHSLSGDWRPYWECHIKPDLLLIYEQPSDEDVLRLIRLGSHAELFG